MNVKRFTVFPSGNVHVLAESGVSDALQDLETSQDFDRIRGEREAIAATDIMRESRGKEGEGSELGVFQGPHCDSGSKRRQWKMLPTCHNA